MRPHRDHVRAARSRARARWTSCATRRTRAARTWRRSSSRSRGGEAVADVVASLRTRAVNGARPRDLVGGTPAAARLGPAQGFLWLMRPKLRTRINRARTDRAARLQGAAARLRHARSSGPSSSRVIYRMLLYFRGTQGIGDLLAGKLLGLAFLTFLSLLLLSNVITALSTFFLSDDLELLVASPDGRAAPVRGAAGRDDRGLVLWMVVLMAVPLLARVRRGLRGRAALLPARRWPCCVLSWSCPR